MCYLKNGALQFALNKLSFIGLLFDYGVEHLSENVIPFEESWFEPIHYLFHKIAENPEFIQNHCALHEISIYLWMKLYDTQSWCPFFQNVKPMNV